MRRPAAVVALVLVVTAGCGGTQEAVPWPPLSPLGAESSARWRAVWDMGGPLDPTARNPCARGSLACMDRVLEEMSARLDRQARRCDHLAPFALMYRQVTDEVASSAREGRYRSSEYAIHLDAVFATLYFRAADAWREGRKDDVPRAWRLAFASAERRELPALGNMLLGMNAHISRDLPYALAATRLQTADGADAEPDVVAVNEDIARAQEPMLRDVAERFDPTVASLHDLGALFDPASIDALVARWRLEAIANARDLLAADTGSERRAVDARIDANATTRALVLWRAAKGQGTPAAIAARDRHCERARDQG